MFKRRRGMTFLLTMVIILVTACSNNNAKQTNSSAPLESASSSNKLSPSETAQSDHDPFGKFPEPVILSVGQGLPANDNTLPEGDTLENNQFTRRIKEVTNVEVKMAWSAVRTWVSGDAYDQKVKLAISSNNLPDAMIVTRSDLELLVKSDLIADLSEIYDQYASPMLKEYYDSVEGRALRSATFNGKLMALPNVVPQADGINVVWIRKDWLNKLSLPEPKTMDELEQTIQAFIDKDPGGNGKGKTLGIVGDRNSLDTLFSAYHAYPSIWYKNNEGKVVWGSTTPETKQALQKLQDMYKKGIIDKEIGLRKDPTEPVAAGLTGVFLNKWYSPWGVLGNATVNNPTAEWIPLTIPVDSEGKFNTKMLPVSNDYLVVRKGYEHLDAVMKLTNVRTNASNEASLYDQSVSPGYWPLRVVTAPFGVEEMYQGVSKALNGEINPDDLAPALKDTYDRYKRVEANKGKIDLSDWAPVKSYMLGGSITSLPMNKVFPVYSAETKSMKLKWPAMLKLEEETFYKIIMNEQPVDSFDKFVSSWNKMGGLEITAEVEEAIK
ncbi:extracellular solute-binding protein [Cohnella abietis]|uniref:ABC transporter substrate-binding protein n=1 Tax=Cohnella abietis TaxID=2507935 RepID=A0A3T1D3P8_9BACL|nr:extracellular solute-binding protein [Cohnella abietis]BBI32733.1 hypothetical protein KCTCHS21_21320 [Cohnella abietis]